MATGAQIGVGTVDGPRQRLELGRVIADRREYAADVRILCIDGCDSRVRRLTRVDDLCGLGLGCRHIAGAIGHAAVRDARSILDHQHTPAMHRSGIVQHHR